MLAIRVGFGCGTRSVFRIFAILGILVLSQTPALAQTSYLGTAVTVPPAYSSTIKPSETTELLLTLSNSNTADPISALALAKTYLPGTYPDGLKYST